MAVVQDVIRAIRSLKGDYLLAKTRPEGKWHCESCAGEPFLVLLNAVFVMAKDQGPAGILETFSSTIVTLSQISRYSSDGSHGLLRFTGYVQ